MQRLFWSCTWTCHANLWMLCFEICKSKATVQSRCSISPFRQWWSSLFEERWKERILRSLQRFPWFQWFESLWLQLLLWSSSDRGSTLLWMKDKHIDARCEDSRSLLMDLWLSWHELWRSTHTSRQSTQRPSSCQRFKEVCTDSKCQVDQSWLQIISLSLQFFSCR